jgi:antitoxin component YwqK of YwqJK toxin-antitoxin module
MWYKNGQKKSEITYKDGKKDGKWTHWRENGEKKSEGTYKDGELNGLWTDGMKWTEG